MKQKILLVLCILCINLALAQTFKVDYIEYTITGQTTVALTDGGGSPKIFNIPSTVNYNSQTYTVTSIGNNAFKGDTGLEGVTIPNTITSIGDWAFDTCVKLTSIIIPDSVNSIGMGAFINCTNLASITLPNSLTTIAAHTFSYCNKLTSIDLPDSLISIQQNAFNYCSSLESVVIPDKVTTIEYFAFTRCSSLTKIVIPASVTSISYEVFTYTALTSIVCNIPTPLVTTYDIFRTVDLSKCILEVPGSSLEAYKAAKEWGSINTIVAKGTLGIDDLIAKKEAILYPNPFSNELFLDLNNSNAVQVEVLDLNGKVVLTKTGVTSTNKFDTGNLASGMYFVKISSENNTSVQKIIKK